MEQPPHTGAGPETTGTDQQEGHEGLREERPWIYVASLSDYNAGILHGSWIDADQEPEELQAEVNEMLARSPSGHAEEFAVHDFELFGDYHVDEYDSLNWISTIASGITEHGPAFAAWAARCDRDGESLERFEDAYRGDWPSIEEYAESLLDDLGCLHELDDAVPEVLRAYVDVDIAGFARDLELGGDITSVDHASGVWIFDGTL